MGLSQEYKVDLTFENQENYMIISVNVERAFGKIYPPFIIKTVRKLRIEGNILNLIKGIYKKLTPQQ